MSNSRRFIVVLFFLSGFASLTYQVAWQRVLTQTIGADAYSVTLIVSIFMLGLGLGSLLGGNVIRGRYNWMLAYAGIEAALGLFGFFSADLIRELSAWLAPAAPGFAIEFAANFALLAFPTILMGMTLPLIVHFARRLYPDGTALGSMYAANIAGAAIGTLITGFVLVGTIGITNTCRVVAVTNFVIAGVALIVGLGSPSERTRNLTPAPPAPRRTISFFLGISFAVGFVALGYEIVFFRLFISYFGMVSYVFPLLLFSYLVWMTVGTWASARAAVFTSTSVLSGWAVLGSIATTLMILFGPSLMLTLHINQERLELDRFATPDIWLQVAKIVVISLILMAPIGFISGLFPILVKAYDRDPETIGKSTSTVYFTQTMGNFFGASLTGLFLLPEFGTINTLRIFGMILVVVPFMFWLMDDPVRRRGRSTIAATVLGIGIVALYPARFYSTIHDFYDAYRFGQTRSLAPAIIHEDAIGATLAYPIPSGFWINIGRERTTPLISRTSAWEIWPLEFVAPLVPRAQRALIIGIGPGMHLPVLERLYPGIQIDVVELNPSLISLMRSEAEASLQASLSRAHVYLTDGRRFILKNASRRYDIIQIGLNNSSSSGSGNLYTREFTTTLRKMLTTDGVLTMDADAAAVQGLLHGFKNVAVLSPGLNSKAGQVAASLDAEGSGARVTHTIAWNADDPDQFRSRLKSADHYPSIVPVDPHTPPIAARPNWQTGCILFRPDIDAVLKPVRMATDDLPVTEYFLTQRETIDGVSPTNDTRVWGQPKGCVPLNTFR